MKLHPIFCILLASALVPGLGFGQLMKKRESIGSLQIEQRTAPAEVAAKLGRINPDYLLYSPTEKPDALVPLVICLHGLGARDGDINRFRWGHFPRGIAEAGEEVPATMILVPQTAPDWDPDSLDHLLDHVLESEEGIDPDRIYCIGFSMGGKGTWEWALHSPERFAAIIPMAFIPDLEGVEALVDLPIWAIVGSRDSGPRVTGIPAMEAALKKLGSEVVQTTVIEGANHGNGAKEARALPGFLTWVFQHSRGEPISD